MPEKEVVLQDVWRTCNKIRAGIFRTRLSLWDFYLPHDPARTSLISESTFCKVLLGPPLDVSLGLSVQEVEQLARYFRSCDGRILYQQFCSVLHGEDVGSRGEQPLVSGLEWEDPLHRNVLSPREQRRLDVLLTKIAATVNARRLLLRPFFQDYELVAKNVGTVTISHFSRVLAFMGIQIAPDEFLLVLKKFLKDSYTVNYVAFVTAIENVIRDLERQGALDVGGDTLAQFPGRVLTAELPKLPRPELGRVCFTPQVRHPALQAALPDEGLARVLQRLQAHVRSEGIRTADAFAGQDPHRTGRVSRAQFRRALDALGLAGTQRMYLSDAEMHLLAEVYRDPNDEARVCWQTFRDDVDRVFTTRELEKYPDLVLDVPPEGLDSLPRRGAKEPSEAPSALCRAALDAVSEQLRVRQVELRPCLRDYDKQNWAHVTPTQFGQALQAAGVEIPEGQQAALLDHFSDAVGFDYFRFLDEVEPLDNPPLYEEHLEMMKRLNSEKPPKKPSPRETNIVEILAKIKAQVVKKRIRVQEFLRDFDKNNQQCICKENFVRGLDVLGIELTPTEVQTLCEVFASPTRPGHVDYRRVCDVAEEASAQAGLERAPLVTPVQHLAVHDGDHNFLNFEERQAVTRVLERLAEHTDYNYRAAFKDWDPSNIGTVSAQQLLKVLSLLGLAPWFSGRELDVLAKCFGVERGLRLEVDYRALCRALDILHHTGRRHV